MTISRSHGTWKLRTRSLPYGRRTLLMGILNVTPDSFSDGNRFFTPDKALEQAQRLLDDGADLLDLGGESTRPDATALTAAEEQSRILPVLRGLLALRPDAVISVDTYHAETAQAALQAGAEIINDVSGLLWDPAMAGVIAAEQPPGAVLMHTRGAPRHWRELPRLRDEEVMPLIVSGLTHTLNLADQASIPRENIVLDPGFGFGKLGGANFVLLAQFAQLQQFGLPLLAGLSRKRFLAEVLQEDTQEKRDQATAAANVTAILGGAHILRVHNISAARTAANLADQVLATGD